MHFSKVKIKSTISVQSNRLKEPDGTSVLVLGPGSSFYISSTWKHYPPPPNCRVIPSISLVKTIFQYFFQALSRLKKNFSRALKSFLCSATLNARLKCKWFSQYTLQNKTYNQQLRWLLCFVNKPYFHRFPGPVIIFKDLLVLQNATIKFQDLPGPVQTLSTHKLRR